MQEGGERRGHDGRTPRNLVRQSRKTNLPPRLTRAGLVEYYGDEEVNNGCLTAVFPWEGGKSVAWGSPTLLMHLKCRGVGKEGTGRLVRPVPTARQVVVIWSKASGGSYRGTLHTTGKTIESSRRKYFSPWGPPPKLAEALSISPQSRPSLAPPSRKPSSTVSRERAAWSGLR
jgi:hypothetical protein